jgi:TIGR03009 family protein
MRYGLVLAVLLGAGLVASAQGRAARTPPTVPDRAAQERLDGYLQRWEQEMRKVETLGAQLTRTDKDKTFETSKKLVGYARYMRVGAGARAVNLGDLVMYKAGTKEMAEKILCTGTFVYRYLPGQKKIEVYEVPKKKDGGLANDSFLSFFFGMRAADARARYDLKLAKEDKWYIYVDIRPRRTEDKADFTRARLVLNRDSFLPRQLWFETANGTETTWDIPDIRSGVKFKEGRRSFDPPRTPEGWKMTKVPVTPPKSGGPR